MQNTEFLAEQKERVENLKVGLIKKLQPWMEGKAKEFADSIHAEAEILRQESYGAELLQHVRSSSLLPLFFLSPPSPLFPFSFPSLWF